MTIHRLLCVLWSVGIPCVVCTNIGFEVELGKTRLIATHASSRSWQRSVGLPIRYGYVLNS